MSQSNPEKLRLFNVSGVYKLAFDLPIDNNDEPIRWSCERFWYKIPFDICLLRRYIEIEVELEEYEED